MAYNRKLLWELNKKKKNKKYLWNVIVEDRFDCVQVFNVARQLDRSNVNSKILLTHLANLQ